MNDVARAVMIGAVSGARSMLGLALVAHGALPPVASAALAVMAVGELVADKHPAIGSRTDPLPLAGRIATGAIAASALASPRNRSWAALLGGASALGAAFACRHLRQYATEQLVVPAPVAGLAEDALALGVGYLAQRRL